VEITDARRIVKTEVGYEYPNFFGVVDTVFFDYTNRMEEDGEGRLIQVDPQIDLNRDRPELPARIRPTEVFVRVQVGGPEWPGREYMKSDLDEISDHTEFSTVQNGVGVVFAVVEEQEVVPKGGAVEECSE
jgi:hypothetical protein